MFGLRLLCPIFCFSRFLFPIPRPGAQLVNLHLELLEGSLLVLFLGRPLLLLFRLLLRTHLNLLREPAQLIPEFLYLLVVSITLHLVLDDLGLPFTDQCVNPVLLVLHLFTLFRQLMQGPLVLPLAVFVESLLLVCLPLFLSQIVRRGLPIAHSLLCARSKSLELVLVLFVLGLLLGDSVPHPFYLLLTHLHLLRKLSRLLL